MHKTRHAKLWKRPIKRIPASHQKNILNYSKPTSFESAIIKRLADRTATITKTEHAIAYEHTNRSNGNTKKAKKTAKTEKRPSRT